MHPADVIDLPASALLGSEAASVNVRVGPARLLLASTGEVELRQLRAGQVVAVYELAADEPPLTVDLAAAHQLSARRSRATATLTQPVVLTVQELRDGQG